MPSLFPRPLSYFLVHPAFVPDRQYNVLDAGEGRGDELYGVEPASFYVKNLFLNTSIAFPLAVALPFLALPLYPMADKVSSCRREGRRYLRVQLVYFESGLISSCRTNCPHPVQVSVCNRSYWYK